MRNPIKLLALALPAAAAMASETAFSPDTEVTKNGKAYGFHLNDQIEVVKIEEDSEDD